MIAELYLASRKAVLEAEHHDSLKKMYTHLVTFMEGLEGDKEKEDELPDEK